MATGPSSNFSPLSRLDPTQSTRSFSPENPTGAKARGGRHEDAEHLHSRELGMGWKVRPLVRLLPGESAVMADIEGPGTIQHIWLTPTGNFRFAILRFYWDGEKEPSIEVPVADFFASVYSTWSYDKLVHPFRPIDSLPVCVNPGSSFNCYWPMPFRRRGRITIENISYEEIRVYYQVTCALGPVPDEAAYLHAQFRRSHPLGDRRVHVVLDGVRGQGHYVGTCLALQVNNDGWWGEGEIKFYLDGDLPGGVVGDHVKEHGGDRFPTICGTGAEDYFCGSYGFIDGESKTYREFTTPYAGMPHVVRPDGAYHANTRFALYRWHIADPIRFQQDLGVTLQALGWRAGGRYLPCRDDLATVAFWYQAEPHAPFPALPDRDGLEII